MALSALLDFEMQSAMWSLHCNFWSKMTPKTLIDFVDVMISLFNLTLIGGVSFSVLWWGVWGAKGGRVSESNSTACKGKEKIHLKTDEF